MENKAVVGFRKPITKMSTFCHELDSILSGMESIRNEFDEDVIFDYKDRELGQDSIEVVLSVSCIQSFSLRRGVSGAWEILVYNETECGNIWIAGKSFLSMATVVINIISLRDSNKIEKKQETENET